MQRCSFPIGPRNTISNAAFPLVGFLLILMGDGPADWVMAATLLYLGIGSALYHGLKRGWANQLDRSGMYAVFTALVVHGIAPAHPWIPALMGSAAFGAALLFPTVVKIDLDTQMGMSLVLALLPAYLLGNVVLATVSLALFALAYGCWQLDKRTSVLGLWGHSLWHVLTAPAIGLLYLAQVIP